MKDICYSIYEMLIHLDYGCFSYCRAYDALSSPGLCFVLLIRRCLLRDEDRLSTNSAVMHEIHLQCFPSSSSLHPAGKELNEKEKKPELNLARRTAIAANKDTVAVRTTRDVGSYTWLAGLFMR